MEGKTTNPITPSEPRQNNVKPNTQPVSLVNSGRVIEPISTDLANSSPSPSVNQSTPETTPQVQASSTVPQGFSPTATYPYLAQAGQQLPSNGTLSDTATSQNTAFLTGSQIQQEKKKMPIGIYVIASFNLLAFAISFFDSSQNSVIYTVVMFIDLLLAIGLLLRLEAARKFILWLQAITLILTVAGLFLLIGLQQRTAQLKANYDTAISRIDQNKLTPAQKQQLEAMNAAIAVQEKQAGKAISFTYFKLGATAAGTIAVMAYLTRPKVKEVFHGFEA